MNSCKNHSAEELWFGYHHRWEFRKRYPTEFVVRIFQGGNYPDLKMNKQSYEDARILDLSCGDGRNLEFLLNLGFRVYATEISSSTLEVLKKKFSRVDFKIAYADSLPYPDAFFDYVLACHSFYYLREKASVDDNLAETVRILAAQGRFVGSILAPDNFLVKASKRLDDGSLEVVDDPFKLRNGDRVQDARSEQEVRAMLLKHFRSVSIGTLLDDYFGLNVNAYIFVCKK